MIIILLSKTIQIGKQILCLDNPADDDLHKIYFIESEKVKGKYHRVIATAFGATSCSCTEQTENPYQHCKHMKILDEIMEHSTNRIQKTSNIH